MRALVAVPILIGSSAALAEEPEDLSLEDLVTVKVDSVFAASKYEQKVTRAPASVSIVTADDIKKFGYRTLADVLRATRGFYVSNDRNYSYLGSRGFLRPGDYNTRYLFLIDGHRMNDNIFDMGYIGNEGALDVDLIERVEIVRGPSSSIYGNSAFLGVINIVTKTARQVDGAEGSVEVGSFDTYKGRFTFGKTFANDLAWMVSGSYLTSGGQETLYYPEFDQRISSDPRARNDGVARDSDGETAYRVFTRASYHDFTVTALYHTRTKVVPTASFGTFFGTAQERMADAHAYVELQYDHRFNASTELLGRISYDLYPFVSDLPYDFGTENDPADVVIEKDGTLGDWLTADVQVKQRVGVRHTVVAGVEFREDLRQQMYNYDEVSPRVTNIDDKRSGRRFAAYGQIETALRPNLFLDAGLRYDHYDSFGGTLNPRVGLIYSPWERSTFKLLYGQAFRAPNDYERNYGAAAFRQGPNPGLRPENIRTYEGIYEQYLPPNLRFSASIYFDEIRGLISQTLDSATDVFIFENVDDVDAKGVELEVEGKYARGLNVRVSYALQRAVNGTTDEELTSSPRHLVKGNLAVPLLWEKLFAALELQYQGSVRTLAGHREDDFLIGNLTLFGTKLMKGLEVSASAYNIFDTRYAFPGADHLQDIIGQDGRSFRLKLSYRFQPR